MGDAVDTHVNWLCGEAVDSAHSRRSSEQKPVFHITREREPLLLKGLYLIVSVHWQPRLINETV